MTDYELSIRGGFECIAFAVQGARDAKDRNEITQQKLNEIKAIAKLTDAEVDAIVQEARDR